MANVLRAQYKQKEFKRLADYALNQMTIIEVGLNTNSVGRGIYNNEIIIAPSPKEIRDLNSTLLELRENILTFEERELLR